MNRKKFFIAALALNTAALAFSPCFYHLLACQNHEGGDSLKQTALSGASGKFGPVIEAILPAANADGRAQILNLENGHAKIEPGLEEFRFRGDAIMTWIRTNGLDISCKVWSTGATCITYDMIVVPVEGKCWTGNTEDDLANNPALAPKRHSPRRQLVVGNKNAGTYMFRTGEGTLGLLQVVGLTPDRHGVTIRYKLINPAAALSAAL